MSSVTPLFRSTTKADTFYFLYFLLHIPITILIDSSLVISKEYLFPFQRDLIEFHITSNKDFLLENPPFLLVIFGWIEVLFQLPFFFIGAYYLYKRNPKIELYIAFYGLEASLTTMYCICYVFLLGKTFDLTNLEINKLVFVYLPTFVIPFCMLLDTSKRFETEMFKEFELKKKE